MTKSGFVALIGRPNAGKSTILNRLVGEKIAIVSNKPQTTRHRILGVQTRDESQAIFVDTPGIHRPGHRLNDRMMEEVYECLHSVDLVVQVVDASENFGKGEEYVLNLIQKTNKPTILVLNKVDVMNRAKVLPTIDYYNQQYEYRELIPLSADKGDNFEVLEQKIAENLPEREWQYPEDYLTNQTERSLVSEIIREKVLHHTHKELPYATAVLMEVFDEERREQGFVRICASIIVDKVSQKKIVIGRGGRMIKAIGTKARLEIQECLQVKKVYLDLNVKTMPGWRDRDHLLDQLGVRSTDYIDLEHLTPDLTPDP
ncbi:MAG: GTPase Era [Acidobacteriota bacterium]